MSTVTHEQPRASASKRDIGPAEQRVIDHLKRALDRLAPPELEDRLDDCYAANDIYGALTFAREIDRRHRQVKRHVEERYGREGARE